MVGTQAGDPADPVAPVDTCSRRDALRLALAAPALLPLATLAACSPKPEVPPGTVVELSTLAEGERVVVMHGEEPVELVRSGRTVRARSLWCTHMGCRVRWVAPHSFYSCPCHGGIFDADGKPIFGPPSVALRTTTLEAVGERVVIPPRTEPLPRPATAPAPSRVST